MIVFSVYKYTIALRLASNSLHVFEYMYSAQYALTLARFGVSHGCNTGQPCVTRFEMAGKSLNGIVDGGSSIFLMVTVLNLVVAGSNSKTSRETATKLGTVNQVTESHEQFKRVNLQPDMSLHCCFQDRAEQKGSGTASGKVTLRSVD